MELELPHHLNKDAILPFRISTYHNKWNQDLPIYGIYAVQRRFASGTPLQEASLPATFEWCIHWFWFPLIKIQQNKQKQDRRGAVEPFHRCQNLDPNIGFDEKPFRTYVTLFSTGFFIFLRFYAPKQYRLVPKQSWHLCWRKCCDWICIKTKENTDNHLKNFRNNPDSTCGKKHFGN